MKSHSILVSLIIALLAGSAAEARYSGGTGEPNDPYRIATAEDLIDIGNHTEDFNKCFILTADIDLDPNLPGNKVFTTAIIAKDTDSYGFKGTPFKGVFDGNGHKISNLTIDPQDVWRDNIGLFGYVDSTSARITNLGLINTDVNLLEYRAYITGSLVGQLMRGTVTNCYVEGGRVHGDEIVGGLIGISIYGYIVDCYTDCNVYGKPLVGGLIGDNRGLVSGCHAHGSISGMKDTGGLIGEDYMGTVINSYATGPVTGRNVGLPKLTGGLIGLAYDSTVTDCFATGPVTGVTSVGGLTGSNDYPTIIRCYATGDVNGINYVGGLVGGYGNGNISQCYAMGDVNGSLHVGGLVGGSYNGTITNCYSTGSVTGNSKVGGLVGYNDYDCIITNCYSASSVNGNDLVGGLVGDNYEDTVIASFWDIETSGQSESYGGTPKTTAEMKTKGTFTDTGWDFVEIWGIGENQTYPFLLTDPAGDSNHDGKVDFADLAILASHWLEEK